MARLLSDMTGRVFGYWKVLSFARRDKSNQPMWLCECVCGTEKVIVGGSLIKGRSKSCGCKTIALRKQKLIRHGMASTPTYKSWHAMHQRCEGKGGHHTYTAKGIQVCDEWYDIQNFIRDMGVRPTGYTLDRIDNTKGYYKENCRWATEIQQKNNRSCNVFLEYNGERLTITETARKYGLGVSCLRHRLTRGMTLEKALTTPAQVKNRK